MDVTHQAKKNSFSTRRTESTLLLKTWTVLMLHTVGQKWDTSFVTDTLCRLHVLMQTPVPPNVSRGKAQNERIFIGLSPLVRLPSFTVKVLYLRKSIFRNKTNQCRSATGTKHIPLLVWEQDSHLDLDLDISPQVAQSQRHMCRQQEEDSSLYFQAICASLSFHIDTMELMDSTTHFQLPN